MLFGLIGGKSFDPSKDIPDLSGKVYLVTGGNTGLGLETCLQLAKHSPSHIFLAARTKSKAEAAIESIKAAVPGANVTHIPLDLTSFASIKAAADQFKAASGRLDVLINNAGIMATPLAATEDGYEAQFGTNHVGHALLTHLLLPVLQDTAKTQGDARVVNLSSEGHNLAFSGITTDKAAMDSSMTWTRYGNSKLANIFHARALAKHHPMITAVSLHPGLISTDLYAASTGGNVVTRTGLSLVSSLPGIFSSVAQGAHNQLWAATCPKSALTNGAYYGSTGEVSKGGWHARSDEQAERLWAWTNGELAAKGF